MIELSIYLFVVGVLVWLSVLSFYLYKTINHYNKLINLSKEDNLSSVLEKIIKELNVNKEEIENLRREIEVLEKSGISHIQKLGLLRYNPFTDVGGDQSFALSLLDGNNNGVVVTSLHGRDQTRWYGKKVVNGEGAEHQLSEEEKKVIKESQNLKIKKR
jgi:hypothetical protein